MQIPLEDNFEDIISKAQRGLGFNDEELAFRAGISVAALRDMKSGRVLEGPARLVSPLLGLHADSLLAVGRHAWKPAPVELTGLLAFNTLHGDMTVNSFIVFDPETKSAALFDTGADASGGLAAIMDLGLKLERIYITHTHPDHIAALPAWKTAFPDAAVKVGRGELFDGAEPVDDGMTFTLGKLAITARETSGHSRCAMTYIVEGLAQPLAIVGDALFSASMGGAQGAWSAALTANRRRIFSLAGFTVICPGHGPLTTVAEERAHNPFYPEFKPPANPAMQEKIAFVGVGRMGANMARRVKETGYQVTAVYDVNMSSAADLAAEIGATAYDKLSEVTAAADVIFTVVTNDEAMKAIFYREGDNLLTGAAGKIFVNCATLSPGMHVQIEKDAEAAGASSIEGCMASSIPQARQGTLQLMIGGKREVFDKVEPLLKKMSAVLTYVGPAGKAAEVKALVNMVMNINTAALAEGLGLGAALGLDLTMLSQIFSVTGANSRVLQTDGEDMVNREHSCFFSAEHAAKDSNIALALAKEKGLALPLAAATAAQYERMVSEGLGELDKSGIAELTFPGRTAYPAK
ncbi:MAG TPA: NAD(P)-binding domain-containing protein [Verrucomicrobiales bacterium]|nr:NAD(P)-binding domain-containing protein [Verrucomicrobiales bacterium]